jgi:hypothetical protein
LVQILLLLHQCGANNGTLLRQHKEDRILKIAEEREETFIVVVLATGSMVVDAKIEGRPGLPFAFGAFVIVAVEASTFLAKSPWPNSTPP